MLVGGRQGREAGRERGRQTGREAGKQGGRVGRQAGREARQGGRQGRESLRGRLVPANARRHPCMIRTSCGSTIGLVTLAARWRDAETGQRPAAAPHLYPWCLPCLFLRILGAVWRWRDEEIAALATDNTLPASFSISITLSFTTPP